MQLSAFVRIREMLLENHSEYTAHTQGFRVLEAVKVIQDMVDRGEIEKIIETFLLDIEKRSQ